MAQNTKNNKNKQAKQQSVKKALQEKSSAQLKKTIHIPGEKPKSEFWSWTLGCFLLLSLIGLALFYDTEVNGKGAFEKSAVGKLLKDAGLLPHVERAWVVTMSTSARVYQFIEKHLPPYLAPTFELCGNLYLMARNALCELGTTLKTLWLAKWPFVANFIDEYMPGFSQKLEIFAAGTAATIADIFGKSVSFIQTQVFVGRLSPESISKTLNDTQNAALEIYSLFQQKVNAYAKLK